MSVYPFEDTLFSYAQVRIWKFAVCGMRTAWRVVEKGIPLLDLYEMCVIK